MSEHDDLDREFYELLRICTPRHLTKLAEIIHNASEDATRPQQEAPLTGREPSS